jgi:hypothetical protein
MVGTAAESVSQYVVCLFGHGLAGYYRIEQLVTQITPFPHFVPLWYYLLDQIGTVKRKVPKNRNLWPCNGVGAGLEKWGSRVCD